MRVQDKRRTFLILSSWGLLAATAIFGVAIYLRMVWQSTEEAAYRRAEAAAAVAEQTLLRSYEAVRSLLDLVELRETLYLSGDTMGRLALDQYLRVIVTEGRFGVASIGVLDRDGRIAWSTTTTSIGVSVVDRDHYRAHLRPGSPRLVISPPVQSLTSGRWIVSMTRRLDDEAGNLSSIAVVNIDAFALSDALALLAAEPGHLLLVRRLSDGRVRAASNQAAERFVDAPATDHPIAVAARQAPQGRMEFITVKNHRHVLAAWRVPHDLPLVVSAAFDWDAEFVDYRQFAAPVVMACALFVFGSLVVSLVWNRNARLRWQLYLLSTRDPLTGLDNRRSLEDRLGSRGQLTGTLAVLLFDIDHFKRINDSHGHATGDRVLRDVARTLQSKVRQDDIVCRWGGEEMLIVLRSCSPLLAARRAENLRAAIAGIYASSNDPVVAITASIGVACFPGDGSTLDALVHGADAALYRAKAAGRNRVELAAASALPAPLLILP